MKRVNASPVPPLEVSGMKAALNGAPQLSIMDGWWLEGFTGINLDPLAREM